METLEFVMRTDLSSALPAVLDFNFDELKERLSSALELYCGLVVTEDGIKAAKQDRAGLNKLRDALESKRKEVKKACMAPYTDFESKVKELVSLVDEPIAAIDGQLRAYEERRRSDKRAEVLAVYEAAAGELRSVLPFERIWRDEWYNTTAAMKKIKESVMASVEKTTADLEVLSTVESEFSETVKLKYLDTLDISAALAERARLQEQAKRLLEYEEQRARVETAETARPEAPASTHPAHPEPRQEAEPAQQSSTETVYRLRFECAVTAAQAQALAWFLTDNHISYRRI